MNFMQEAFECGIKDQLDGYGYPQALACSLDARDSYYMGREHVAAIRDNVTDIRDWLRTL